MGTKYWPVEHRRDVWDAPAAALNPLTTMSSGEAARELGLTRYSLLRYVDALGLTIYRMPTKRRRFSRKEIIDLKDRVGGISVDDIIRAQRKGKSYAKIFLGKKG